MSTPPPLPAHIAIVMDGNGRWAKNKNRPRSMGHQAGLKALRKTIEHCGQLGIGTLTVFAFSSENWRRPASEVSRLMDLFLRAMEKESIELHEHGVCVRFIGDKTAFSTAIQKQMTEAEALTARNDRMFLNIAVSYGGRWDIMQAALQMHHAIDQGGLQDTDVDERQFSRFLALADPDLLIRTGGETRISNFLLWQLAYTELYFSPVLWPDFDAAALDEAISAFQSRERRFGYTSGQVRDMKNA